MPYKIKCNANLRCFNKESHIVNIPQSYALFDVSIEEAIDTGNVSISKKFFDRITMRWGVMCDRVYKF